MYILITVYLSAYPREPRSLDSFWHCKFNTKSILSLTSLYNPYHKAISWSSLTIAFISYQHRRRGEAPLLCYTSRPHENFFFILYFWDNPLSLNCLPSPLFLIKWVLHNILLLIFTTIYITYIYHLHYIHFLFYFIFFKWSLVPFTLTDRRCLHLSNQIP